MRRSRAAAHRSDVGRSVWPAVAVVLALAVGTLPLDAVAGTTGRLSGRVTNPKKEPLQGANVILVGVPLGAATEADGSYTIVNIPAGTYSVKVSLIGHTSTTVTGVVVSADKSTTQDATLLESALQMQEVVVTAKRPVVELDLTHNVATLSRAEIAKLPVQELQDVVNLQAGVVDGHFRGGRAGEVQYQVDGVTVNNVFNNASTVKLDRSVLEEVQVISGTFDAEYGQAMSGVVNAVLRRGTEKFEWSGEALGGSYQFDHGRRFFVNNPIDAVLPQDHRSIAQSLQLTVSGPAGLPKTVFLANARRASSDDYRRALRVFRPTDRRDSLGFFHPSGDGKDVPLGDSRGWSGLLKLTNRSLPGIVLDYQAVGNDIDEQKAQWAYRLNPDGQSRQHTRSLVHGFDWTQTLSKSSFYRLSLRQNLIDYNDRVYESLYDPRYDAAGATQSDPGEGVITQGVQFTRFVQRTNTPVLTGSLSTRYRRAHFVKFGGEVQHPHLEFGDDGHLTYNQGGGNQTLVRRVNEPPDFPGIIDYKPWMWAIYGQDEVEWTDLKMRAGVRLEYFDPVATLPGDLANPANSIAGAPAPPPRSASRKYSLMPRVGVSFPVTTQSAVFFAYGHFTQMPPLGDIFSNANYSVLSGLQIGSEERFGVLGNPDVKPERTVQYQFGYRQGVADILGIDLTVFYKDIRNLLGVEFVDTYTGAQYARLTNVDFGNVLGVTVALDQRPIGPFQSSLDYTWQTATGNSSDPKETATRAAAGEDPRPRQVPLNWDQRHTLNLTLEMSKANRYSAGVILRIASGQPYTPTIAAGFGGGLEANSGQKPAGMLLDVRVERQFGVGGIALGAVGRIFNLLDTRFFNGFVFPSTGSPYYSRDAAADHISLADPGRFFGPRRYELGLTFAPEVKP